MPRFDRTRSLSAVLAFALLASAGMSNAHESKPPAKYGGYVVEADEIFFEIVSRPAQLLIYVEDDGKPVDTSHISGTLTYQVDGLRRDSVLKPGGFNLLHADLSRPPRGAPLSVVVVNGAQRIAFTYVAR